MGAGRTGRDNARTVPRRRRRQRHRRCMKGLLQRVFSIAGFAAPIIGYAESKQLVQSRNPSDRRKVAENQHVQPELLYFLATDPDRTVRTAIARSEERRVGKECRSR